STTGLALREGAAGRSALAEGGGVEGAAGDGGAGVGAGWAFASGPLPGARRFTFSTTTTLERPWEKLWRTRPCSTVRGFKCSVLDVGAVKVLSPLFSISLIRFPIPSRTHDPLAKTATRRPRLPRRHEVLRPLPRRKSPRFRPDKGRAVRNAPGRPPSFRPRRAPHVSHLCGPKPNPIDSK